MLEAAPEDIEIEDGWTRLTRRQASEQFPRRVPAAGDESFCDYGDVAFDELAFYAEHFDTVEVNANILQAMKRLTK